MQHCFTSLVIGSSGHCSTSVMGNPRPASRTSPCGPQTNFTDERLRLLISANFQISSIWLQRSNPEYLMDVLILFFLQTEPFCQQSLFLCFHLVAMRPEQALIVHKGSFSLLHRVQTGSGAHPASYLMGTWNSFPGYKASGT
jgi:hypothetical protein